MAGQVTVKWNGDKAVAILRSDAIDRLGEAAVFLQGKIKETLSGSRSGRTYRVPGTKRTYQASAPGEAPASRLGNLRNSIEFEISEKRLETVVGVRGKQAPYGVHLERGTRKMAARPFIGPTMKANRGEIKEILSKGWFA